MSVVWPLIVRGTRSLLDLMPVDRPNTVSSILLFETFGVKDAIAATPAIDALRKTFPNAAITVAATPSSCDIFKNDERVAETVPIATPWVFANASRRALIGSMTKLVSRSFDIVIDMDDSASNRQLMGLIASPVRIGRPGENDYVLTHRAAPVDETVSLSERKLQLIMKTGAQSITTLPSLRLTPTDWRYVDDVLGGLNLGDRPLVAISPDAANAKSRWPEENFAELGNRIQEAHPEAKILFFGAPYDSDKLERVSEKMDKQPSTLLLSLPRLAAFLGRSDLYIGMHSGPSFIAGAVGVRSILMYREKLAHLAPVGPHIRLLTATGDAETLSPAICAQAVNQALTELPARKKEKEQTLNMYLRTPQEATEIL